MKLLHARLRYRLTDASLDNTDSNVIHVSDCTVAKTYFNAG